MGMTFDVDTPEDCPPPIVSEAATEGGLGKPNMFIFPLIKQGRGLVHTDTEARYVFQIFTPQQHDSNLPNSVQGPSWGVNGSKGEHFY